MTTSIQTPDPVRTRRSRPSRTRASSRRVWSSETRIAVGLAAGALATALVVALAPDVMPFTALLIPLVLGSILLGPRTLPWYVVFSLLLLLVSLLNQEELTARVLGAAGVQLVIALIVLVTSLRRTRLGVAGLRGESMFVDLRDRIQNQGGGLPRLPRGWAMESAVYSAGGTAFAGDFVVSSRSGCGRRVEIAVVDVSGKGEEAGVRALLLSGAMGALLGAVPPEGFLPAANDYLVRQDWQEGFATAVHLAADTETGEVVVRTAGHPPAGLLSEGRWHLMGSEGPLLGLVPEAEFVPATGHLRPGGAVLLYTDGMVERPGRDLDHGIDDLLAEAGPLLATAPGRAADRLARRLGSHDDDRTVLVVRRDEG